ncbi:ABC transporter permease [Paenibacillus cymbidii]|uniref:ABC transporter permease n=1 Tax=Paenibacillus cymbidii TaxID=1639034 RepID=UPI001F2B9EAC|nr:ABC transporter permease subunit [Paenibacillus cymbidii]
MKAAASRGFKFKRTWPLHALLLPAVVCTFVFHYIPIAGIVMSFQNFEPWLGLTKSEWVGLEHFRFMFMYRDSKQVIVNTFLIASMKIVFTTLASIVFSLLLNEVRKAVFKRSIQTFVYLPHFLSWVILGGILIDMLSIEGGLVNRTLHFLFGVKPILFLANGDWFRFTIILSDIWKEFGYGTIVFLAALAGINPALYESAEVDGAARWKQTLYITLPSILPICVVVITLQLGNILNAGFDQIFNLYNPLVYSKGDIIDTFVYRTGLVSGNFSFATAVGLFKSVVGMVMIVCSYQLAYRLANYRIF